MGKIKVFASGGKGGTGKTLIAVATAYASATMTGGNVILVGADPHTGSAEMLVEPGFKPEKGWVSYINSLETTLPEVMVKSRLKDNLYIIPSKRGRIFYAGSDRRTAGMKLDIAKKIWEQDPRISLVIIDTPAGKSPEHLVYSWAFDTYLVTTSSEMDLVPTKKFLEDIRAETLEQLGRDEQPIKGIIANMVTSKNDVKRIEEFLRMPCIASVPHSPAVEEANRKHLPVTAYKPEDKASLAIQNIARMFLGLDSRETRRREGVLSIGKMKKLKNLASFASFVRRRK